MTMPTVGRILHFTMPRSTPDNVMIRPAIVVEAWPGASHVNLEVFLTPEAVRDLRPNEVQQLKFRSSVSHSTGYPARNGEWQWPPLRDVALEKLPLVAPDPVVTIIEAGDAKLSPLPPTSEPTDFAPIVAGLPPFPAEEVKPSASVKPKAKRP